MIDLITTSSQLTCFCDLIKNEPFVALDTEFIRQKTYWPVWGLLQLATPRQKTLIDPLAPLDWSPFVEILKDPHITKVLHSGRQDLEIFWKHFNILPTPLFDSQIAAMVLGLGDYRGYDHLVKHFLNETIDKKDQHSNWLERPLSMDQLAYALADVTHLVHLYQALFLKLEESGRFEWMEDELATLLDPNTYQVDHAMAWKRLKSPLLKTFSYNPSFLPIIQQLASWREAEAQRLDLARRFVAGDSLLIHAASNHFSSFEHCQHFLRQSKSPLKALDLEESFYQTLQKSYDLEASSSNHSFLQKKEALSGQTHQKFLELRSSLHKTASELGVPPRLIATKEDLEELAKNDSATHRVHKGWREKVFGIQVSELSITS